MHLKMDAAAADAAAADADVDVDAAAADLSMSTPAVDTLSPPGLLPRELLCPALHQLYAL